MPAQAIPTKRQNWRSHIHIFERASFSKGFNGFVDNKKAMKAILRWLNLGSSDTSVQAWVKRSLSCGIFILDFSVVYLRWYVLHELHKWQPLCCSFHMANIKVNPLRTSTILASTFCGGEQCQKENKAEEHRFEENSNLFSPQKPLFMCHKMVGENQEGCYERTTLKRGWWFGFDFRSPQTNRPCSGSGSHSMSPRWIRLPLSLFEGYDNWKSWCFRRN